MRCGAPSALLRRPWAARAPGPAVARPDPSAQVFPTSASPAVLPSGRIASLRSPEESARGPERRARGDGAPAELRSEHWTEDRRPGGVLRSGPRGSPICRLPAPQCPALAADLGAELRIRKKVEEGWRWRDLTPGTVSIARKRWMKPAFLLAPARSAPLPCLLRDDPLCPSHFCGPRSFLANTGSSRGESLAPRTKLGWWPRGDPSRPGTPRIRAGRSIRTPVALPPPPS